MTNRRIAPILLSGALCTAACGTEDPVPGRGSGASGVPATSGGAPPGGGDGSAAAPQLSTECGERPILEAEFTKRALLTAAADCGMWHYCEFDAAAASLTRAVEAHVAAAGDAMLEPARAAWREAMLVWARAELFQFGPAGSRAHDPYYGASFRDRIYAWPSVSRCRVEEQLVSQSYRDDFNGVLVSSKGLFALEYLLFYPGSDTACAASSATRAAWDALSPTELDQRKRDYALALARNVSSLVSELRAAWDPSAGNFRQTFIDAVGYDKPGSDSDQEALNIVAWSLVYGEKEVKDYKIGPFTGKMLPPAPVDGFEAPFAGLSQEIVVANLEGLRSAYQGCGPQGEGIGFDDWLVAANHAELALSLDTTLAAAIGATRAFPSFEAASQAELASLYDTGVKPFTDLLKNELLAGNGSVLNLSLPASAAADND